MRQGPFLLCLCRRGAFTVFQMIFLFRCSFEPEAESRVWPLAHKWNKPSPTQANREEKFYLPAPTRPAGQIKPYFLAGGLPGFTLPAMSFFVEGISFFTDFSFEVFCLICLYFRLPPFSRLSVALHQAVISVLGAKVTPGFGGKARSSLLFSGKISSLWVVFFPKNLAFPNPYLFKHPKRKRPMRQKDALKKMSDKREADKIVWNSTPSALESALKNKKSKTKRIWERQ